MKSLDLLCKLLGAVAFGFVGSVASSAPVVVQKGSTAQYLYIPAASAAAATGGGSNDGATAAKQFCQIFITGTRNIVINTGQMLDDTVKVAAQLIGGGGGRSYEWTDSNGSRRIAAGGGGGSTALIVNGEVKGVAAGGNGAATVGTPGLPGTKLNVAEFPISRAQAGQTMRAVVGFGAGSGGPIYGFVPPNYYVGIADIAAGYGGAGYFGGGGGTLASASSGGSFSPAGGGTTSGGAAAVAINATVIANGTPGSQGRGGVSGGGNSSYASDIASGGGGNINPGSQYGSSSGKIFYTPATCSGYACFLNYIYWPQPYGGSPYNISIAHGINISQTGELRGTAHGDYGPVNESNWLSYGAGGDNQYTGTSGAIRIYYSAPSCFLS